MLKNYLFSILSIARLTTCMMSLAGIGGGCKDKYLKDAIASLGKSFSVFVRVFFLNKSNFAGMASS